MEPALLSPSAVLTNTNLDKGRQLEEEGGGNYPQSPHFSSTRVTATISMPPPPEQTTSRKEREYEEEESE